MDVGILPAFVNSPAPVVDDGRPVPVASDDPAKNTFGSALVTALGDAGQTPASLTSVVPQAIRPDFRAWLGGDWDLAEAPVLSNCTEDDTPSPAAAVLGYLGLAWPQPVVPPAGAVPVGTSFEHEAAPGDLSGLEAETVPPDAAALTAGPDVFVGVPPAPVNPPGEARQTNPVEDPRGFDLRNGPALPAHGLRPDQMLSRLGLSGGEPRSTASARTGWAASFIGDGPAPAVGAAVKADGSTVVPYTASAWRHEGPVDPGALSVATLQRAEAVLRTLPIVETPPVVDTLPVLDTQPTVDVRLPISDTPAPNDDLTTAFAASPSIVDDATWNAVPSRTAATTPADAPVVPQTARGTDADGVGPRHETPAFARATLRVPPAETAPRQSDQAFVLAQQAAQNPPSGAAPPIEAQLPGQGPRVGMPTVSQAGLRVQPAETATAWPPDASRLEAQRQIADAFLLAQQAVQNPSSGAAPPIEAQPRVVPTRSADRAIVDRTWTGGPQEDIAGALADAVRGIGAAAAHSGTAGQSTGRDESDGRAFERRPPADVPLLYTAATRAATADLAPERTMFNAAARAAAEPTMAEPTADGAPLTHALVQSLKLQWRQGGGEARLRLQPEYLGELTVSLRVQGSTVKAVIQCDSPSVRAWVEAHQADLRRALEEQGLSLDTLTVDPEGHPQPQQEESRQREDQPRKGRRSDPGRFEAFL